MNWKKSLLIFFLAIICTYLPSFGIYLIAESDSVTVWNALDEEKDAQKNRTLKSDREIHDCLLTEGVPVGSPLEAFSTPDPLEAMNRTLFTVNKNIAILIVRKIGRVYELLVPEFTRNRISDFGSHISMPIRFFNNLLQGKFLNALREVGRFLVNAAFGLGGLFDTSTALEFEAPPKEDLAQTLGYWGVGPGVYLVVPFIGPTNTRDFVGYIGNMVFDPLFWFRAVVPGLRAFLTYNEFMTDNKGRRYLRHTEIAADPYYEQKTLQDVLSTALACQ